MDKEYVSRSSINIKAPVAKVWDALVNPEIMKDYFFGAAVATTWEEGTPIVFSGEYQGNKYEEKGIILHVQREKILQYTHWSNIEDLPDLPDNYRKWTFNLSNENSHVVLSLSEDNIPTEAKRDRSDEFWKEVLSHIKTLLEA